jgi:flagellar hook-associated protein 1 FlgK
MGIGQIFSRGLDGLNVNQRGLAATSNNIANMNTKGYSRQEVVITANIAAQGGARVEAVEAITSPFVELQLFNSMNDFGTVDGRRRTVGQIEAMFNESADNGLAKQMNEFFGSFSALSVDPSSSVLRQDVRDRAVALSQRFNSLYEQVNQMRGDISLDISTKVDRVNALASQIAQINEQLVGNTNEQQILDLKGQRLSLLKDLSTEVNCSYFEQDGTMQVAINGSLSLVNGKNAGTLSLSNDLSTGGIMTVNLKLPGGPSASTLNITTQVTGGRLGGALLDRNTTLNDRMDELDELAYNLVTEVNSLHSAGYGLDGTTGVNFFAPLASQSGAARNMAVDATILNDLRRIAAAEQDPAVSGVGDNRTALRLSELQNEKTMTSGSQTFLQFYQGMVGSIGVTAGQVNRDFEIQANLVNQLEIQRESVSGVNLDEEGANIIRYQRAFQASSKLIMTADQMLETLMGIK